jgi:predicted nucleotidyltransferase
MGATQVFIFGSAVKGRLRPDSDIDMAVTGLPSQTTTGRSIAAAPNSWEGHFAPAM